MTPRELGVRCSNSKLEAPETKIIMLGNIAFRLIYCLYMTERFLDTFAGSLFAIPLE